MALSMLSRVRGALLAVLLAATGANGFICSRGQPCAASTAPRTASCLHSNHRFGDDRRLVRSASMRAQSFPGPPEELPGALHSLSRRDLQRVARSLGIKANQKSVVIVSQLLVLRPWRDVTAVLAAQAKQEEAAECEPAVDPAPCPITECEERVGSRSSRVARCGNGQDEGDEVIWTTEILLRELREGGTDAVIQSVARGFHRQNRILQSYCADDWHSLVGREGRGLSRGQRASLYNAVLAVVAEKNLTVAVQVLKGMATEGVAPDVVTYSVCAAGAFRAGQPGLATDVLARAKDAGDAARKASATHRQLKKRAKSLRFPGIRSSEGGREGGSEAHPLSVAVPGLEVLFENEHVLVLSKPNGLLVHPVVGTPIKGPSSATLCDGLLAVYTSNQLSSLGEFPGIVHRLDRGTSGVMCVAKTNKAHALLVSSFFARHSAKTYHALVHGCPPHAAGHVDAEVDGYRASSDWRVMERYGATALDESWAAASLVEVQPLQGRKHQVRAHMASLSCPLLLDPIYSTDSGGRRRNRRKEKGALMPGRQGSKGLALVVGQLTETFKDGRFFLHSACLSLPAWALGDAGCKGTGDENKVAFSAARPAWFDKVISQLRDL